MAYKHIWTNQEIWAYRNLKILLCPSIILLILACQWRIIFPHNTSPSKWITFDLIDQTALQKGLKLFVIHSESSFTHWIIVSCFSHRNSIKMRYKQNKTKRALDEMDIYLYKHIFGHKIWQWLLSFVSDESLLHMQLVNDSTAGEDNLYPISITVHKKVSNYGHFFLIEACALKARNALEIQWKSAKEQSG